MEFFSVVIILLLVFINGFFVASEFALVSIRPSRLDELVKENKIMAILTKKAIEKIDGMLSVCQVGITIASLLLGWVGEEFFEKLISSFFVYLSLESTGLTTHTIAIAISFTLITLLHVILGELVPKTLAIQNTETIANIVSPIMWFFYFLFYPVTALMNYLAGGVLSLFRLQTTGDKYVHSPEELMILIEEQEKKGRIDKGELRLIQKTFDFSENTAKSVMTHRLSIVGVPQDATIDRLLPLIAEHNFSRYPVYDKTLDQITGIIHVQKFLKWIAENGLTKAKKVKITTIMEKEIIKLPESLSIEKAMADLRENKQHMGIVIDEYGGVSGILTLEDIIEEIFGEIRDETDSDDKNIQSSNKKTKSITLDGESEIDQLPEIIHSEDIDGLDEDVRTIAGFIMDKGEGMPIEGTTIEISHGTLKVKKMDGNKILSVVFTPRTDKSLPKDSDRGDSTEYKSKKQETSESKNR